MFPAAISFAAIVTNIADWLAIPVIAAVGLLVITLKLGPFVWRKFLGMIRTR